MPKKRGVRDREKGEKGEGRREKGEGRREKGEEGRKRENKPYPSTENNLNSLMEEEYKRKEE
jgi:hypothetical protein